MRHWLRLALCGGALAALLTCGASAQTPDYTTDVAGTVTYNGDSSYTASYTGAKDGNQYAILVVKGTPGSYSISEDTIMYIDQKAATDTGVSFDFIPRSTPDCVVLLGGEFDGVESPVVLGTLVGKGVTVSGSVELQGRTNHSGATVTLGTSSTITDNSGSYTFNSVSAGETYELKITMPGYLSYTKTSLTVDEEMTVEVKTLLGGDVNETGDGYINADDLLIILQNFVQEIQYPGMDIDGDGYINANELSMVLGNFSSTSVSE